MSKKIGTLLVKTLRERTGLGMMDCKKALTEADGDLKKAEELLRKQTGRRAEGVSGRETSEGTIGNYLHHDGKLIAAIEVRCETDFVAKTDEFKNLASDIAMHIVASKPKFLNRDSIAEEAIEAEREFHRNKFLEEGKPEKIVDKIVEGQMKKFFGENCLLDQVWFKAEKSETVGDVLKAAIAKMGENITLGDFFFLELGAKE
jgi:elongation factor Ts